MSRIVEIVVMVNALAGIAVFLGARAFVRRVVRRKTADGGLTPLETEVETRGR